MSEKTAEELLRCGKMALQYMTLRFGPTGESDDADQWREKLGLVMDAYHELLSGNIKAQG